MACRFPNITLRLLTELTVLILCVVHQVQAATPANATSPLGINLLQMSYYSPEQPFLNIFRTTGVSQATPDAWITHSDSTWDTREQAYLQLDADGYPKTLNAGHTGEEMVRCVNPQ